VFVHTFTYRYTEFVGVGVNICVYVHRVYMGMCIYRMIVMCIYRMIFCAYTYVRGTG